MNKVYNSQKDIASKIKEFLLRCVTIHSLENK